MAKLKQRVGEETFDEIFKARKAKEAKLKSFRNVATAVMIGLVDAEGDIDTSLTPMRDHLLSCTNDACDYKHCKVLKKLYEHQFKCKRDLHATSAAIFLPS